MAPRFANPHLLPDSTVLVSRKQIYIEDDTDAEDATHVSPMDGGLVEELHRLIRASLDSEIQPDARRKKHRKIDVVLDVPEPISPVLFRLISNSQSLHPLLLEPKPPPPPITREPDCEDNAIQAKTRRKQAKAAAVDTSWVQHESQKQTTPSLSKRRKHGVAKMTLPTPNPVMMVLQSDQTFRPIRPPVPASHLMQYPYVKNGPFPSTDAVTKFSDCPVISIDSPKSPLPKNETKHRRKRGKMLNRPRSPPSFWRPNPAHGGKGLGYAMGYPCSIAALENRSSSLHYTQLHYSRDTMRKGVHIDSLDNIT